MHLNSTTSIPDVDACAPPFPWNDAIQQGAGPVAAVLLALAVACAIATIRLRYAGPPWAATTTKVIAVGAVLAGGLCLLAIPMTRTC